jgi:hypothetical protein
MSRSGNRKQVRPQIGPLIGQTEFDTQVFAMKIDGGFGNIQNIGNFLAGFAVFDQTGHLHLLGCQQNLRIGKTLQQGGDHVIEVCLNNFDQGFVPGFEPRVF